MTYWLITYVADGAQTIMRQHSSGQVDLMSADGTFYTVHGIGAQFTATQINI